MLLVAALTLGTLTAPAHGRRRGTGARHPAASASSRPWSPRLTESLIGLHDHRMPSLRRRRSRRASRPSADHGAPHLTARVDGCSAVAGETARGTRRARGRPSPRRIMVRPGSPAANSAMSPTRATEPGIMAWAIDPQAPTRAIRVHRDGAVQRSPDGGKYVVLGIPAGGARRTSPSGAEPPRSSPPTVRLPPGRYHPQALRRSRRHLDGVASHTARAPRGQPRSAQRACRSPDTGGVPTPRTTAVSLWRPPSRELVGGRPLTRRPARGLVVRDRHHHADRGRRCHPGARSPALRPSTSSSSSPSALPGAARSRSAWPRPARSGAAKPGAPCADRRGAHGHAPHRHRVRSPSTRWSPTMPSPSPATGCGSQPTARPAGTPGSDFPVDDSASIEITSQRPRSWPEARRRDPVPRRIRSGAFFPGPDGPDDARGRSADGRRVRAIARPRCGEPRPRRSFRKLRAANLRSSAPSHRARSEAAAEDGVTGGRTTVSTDGGATFRRIRGSRSPAGAQTLSSRPPIRGASYPAARRTDIYVSSRPRTALAPRRPAARPFTVAGRPHHSGRWFASSAPGRRRSASATTTGGRGARCQPALPVKTPLADPRAPISAARCATSAGRVWATRFLEPGVWWRRIGI